MLHIVVPGLLWPKDSVADVLRGLDLPALNTLLGRARCSPSVVRPFEYWLCHVFGVQGGELPIGAIRLLGDGIDPGKEAWLCADPVHLRFSRNTLVIDAAGPDLAPREAAQLVIALNQQMGEFGKFLAPHPRRWYLQTPRVPRIATHPLSTVTGRAIEPFLPLGEEAREWRRLINDAQVLLHNHPINAERESAGRPTANSLWPWGAGSLPPAVVARVPHVHAENPLALGLAKLARIPATPLPKSRDDAIPDSLILLETLYEAAQGLDAAAWRKGMQQLESRWFAPILAALKARRMRGLRMTALGDQAIVKITLDVGDAWQFWRRPRTLADLP